MVLSQYQGVKAETVVIKKFLNNWFGLHILFKLNLLDSSYLHHLQTEFMFAFFTLPICRKNNIKNSLKDYAEGFFG